MKGGKKRTVSALVVVGNGNGMAGQKVECSMFEYTTCVCARVCVCVRVCVGFAVGKGEELRAAIRKVFHDHGSCHRQCYVHTI